jgi:hypothetical protein
MITLTTYFAIGLIFAFGGPAARERRREQQKAKLECSTAPLKMRKEARSGISRWLKLKLRPAI